MITTVEISQAHRAGAALLALPPVDIPACSRVVPEASAVYLWQLGWGGGAVLVDTLDCSALLAPSATSFESHLRDFQKGKRTRLNGPPDCSGSATQ